MKTELSLLAAQYSQALLELALDQGNAEVIQSDLKSINQTISADPKLGLVLKHPSVPFNEKKDLLVQLFQGKVQPLTLKLLDLLANKRRLSLLSEIAVQYHKALLKQENIVTATLTSAQSLSDGEYQLLQSKLAEQLGKKLELTTQVDESLIAGIVLTIGDQVIDGSISGKLKAMEKQLLSLYQ